ncbi:MAG: ATP-binding cassette domain-containing protein, partial [Limnohabitans sp.]|nr:ATP-binding cassette domain-containing protein [Limnohabitans sp.]
MVLGRLHVERDQTVFLHGPSGCGKSTLLGLLSGVLSPREGRVSLLGQDWAALKPGQARTIGWEQLIPAGWDPYK